MDQISDTYASGAPLGAEDFSTIEDWTKAYAAYIAASATPVTAQPIQEGKVAAALTAMGVRADAVWKWAAAFEDQLVKYKCTTPERLAGLLGQLAVESTLFTRTEENLRYTTLSQLTSVFGSKVQPNPAQYLKNPKALAMKVYGNKSSLGNKTAQDGWDFRGSGLIQTTGRYNIAMLGKRIGVDLEKNPDLLRTDPDVIVQGALYFYMVQRNCWKYADKCDWLGVTKLINSASLQATDRVNYTKMAYKALKA
jgi:putative chitinase